MSEKCRKNVRKMSRGAENTIFGHFLDNFCLFGRCFGLMTLSNARPLQLWGVFGASQARSFEKGLAVGARRSFLCQRCRPLFCTLFPTPPVGEEGHNSGEPSFLYVGSCWSPTANPFSEALTKENSLSGPDGSRHSSDQHPKDPNSKNVNYCPIFVREFLSSRRQTPEVRNFWVFAVFEFLSNLPRNSRASRGQKFRFLVFFVFCGHKLLRAC